MKNSFLVNNILDLICRIVMWSWAWLLSNTWRGWWPHALAVFGHTDIPVVVAPMRKWGLAVWDTSETIVDLRHDATAHAPTPILFPIVPCLPRATTPELLASGWIMNLIYTEMAFRPELLGLLSLTSISSSWKEAWRSEGINLRKKNKVNWVEGDDAIFTITPFYLFISFKEVRLFTLIPFWAIVYVFYCLNFLKLTKSITLNISSTT